MRCLTDEGHKPISCPTLWLRAFVVPKAKSMAFRRPPADHSSLPRRIRRDSRHIGDIAALGAPPQGLDRLVEPHSIGPMAVHRVAASRSRRLRLRASAHSDSLCSKRGIGSEGGQPSTRNCQAAKAATCEINRTNRIEADSRFIFVMPQAFR